jgi:hypothetical protein
MLTTSSSNVYDDQAWELLREKFRCTICQDVCAAPVLLNSCSDSFCGFCIDQLKTRCIAEDQLAVKVLHSCPNCNKNFETATYERNYDYMIAEQAMKFPQHLKEAWQDRRDQYLFHMKQKEARAHVAMFAEGNQETNGDQDNEAASNESWWSELIPIVAFTLLVLIALARSR